MERTKDRNRIRKEGKEWKWCNGIKKEKMKVRESLWREAMNHATWRMGYSKMGGEETPLEMLCTQDWAQGWETQLTKHSDRVSFLF